QLPADRTDRHAGCATLTLLRAHRLHGRRDSLAIPWRQWDALAVQFESSFRDRAGDQTVGLRRDRHHLAEAEVVRAELFQVVNLAVGLNTADAGVLLAGFLPREAELLV